MKIQREVEIFINSLIDNIGTTGLPDGEREESATTALGTMDISPDGIVISFSENTDGGAVNTEIELSDVSIRVVRRGAIVSDMTFSEGESHSSVYSIPPYSFDAQIFTRRIRGKIDAGGGFVDIFYDMEIGGAKKSVKMKLSSRIKE